MKIAISGASGMIGSALLPVLRGSGHEVLRLVRHEPSSADEARWDPSGSLDPAVLADVEAVIHLAAPGVGDKRWTDSYKRELHDARVLGTTTIAKAIAAASPRPRVLLSASAVGYYGDTGDHPADESAPLGSGFLAELCEEWEAAAQPAADAGTRVVLLRTGLVLTGHGGLLAQLAVPFKFGIGGKLGSGRQYMPWISLRDEIGAIEFLLAADSVSGPVNLAAPNPVTNAEFTRALGAALHRPAVLPIPGIAVRAIAGELANEAALIGQRAIPTKLLEHGYQFQDTELEPTLREALAK
ncbi:MAG: uncharacterized protein QOD41_1481 [Cryptosporangiaceae bacterium]|jgi:uncharacterized protein (TIGR01777 family)|nr:uncharacterized protein [Cryptosporangiaceae bacterium]